MSDSEPINLFGAGTGRQSAPSSQFFTSPRKPHQISFSRTELNEILRLYGRKVAAGEWRDYAIDALKERAVFSVFRNACEMPLYRIVKHPKQSRKQGQYSVVTPTGLILRRGPSLAAVLKVIEGAPKLVLA